jgi:hypothetical protein
MGGEERGGEGRRGEERGGEERRSAAMWRCCAMRDVDPFYFG